MIDHPYTKSPQNFILSHSLSCPITTPTHISAKVSQCINLLRRLSWFLPSSLLVLYLKSYILPCVDYCDIVWDCCSKLDSNCLQTLFNYACCIAWHRPRLSSSSALWNDLGLSLLSSCRKLHLAQLMFKCHNSLAPSYLSSLSMNHLTGTLPATVP